MKFDVQGLAPLARDRRRIAAREGQRRGCFARLALLAAFVIVMPARDACALESSHVSIQLEPDRLVIRVGGEPFANYVFNDPTITRPYFAQVHAPGGVQATRNQPPVAGQDLMDHPTFHPGVWLAFGDLSSADDWRLAAPVKNVGVDVNPLAIDGEAKFTARNRYLPANGGDPICEEVFRCTIRVIPQGYLIDWDSTFTSDREFTFGDQEEMGLGLRVATPLRASRQADGEIPAGNGEIRDAKGRVNEAGVWGQAADWCDYSGEIDGQRVGMTIFCHPENFHPSSFHARDRGLLVANPFGRAAFRKGEPSRVVVKPGESLQLRYGILVHATSANGEPIDIPAAYSRYYLQQPAE